MALGDRFLRKATPDDDAKSVKELIPSGKKSALLKRLEDEYDIQINTHSTDLANYRGTILEAPPEALHIFAPMAAALPSLAANVQSQGILTRQLYTVTSKGSDVMPNQLWQKKNGALLTNSRQPNSGAFGNQNDLKPLDPKKLKAAQAANVASMVFSVASVATQTYYLHEIDNKLNSLQEGVDTIIAFLEQDKQSKLTGNWSTLQEIGASIQQIRQNSDTKVLMLNRLAIIQNESRDDVDFYLAQIRSKVANYVSGKDEEKAIQGLIQAKQCYQFSLCEYSLSKLIELMLTNSFDADYMANVRTELERMSGVYQQTISGVSKQIHSHFFERSETKVRIALADTLQAMSEWSVSKTVGLSDALQKASSDGKEYLAGQRRDLGITLNDDEPFLASYIADISLMEAQSAGTVQLLFDASSQKLCVGIPEQ